MPRIEVRRLAGSPGRPVLVVGPSLGTSVTRLWGDVAAAVPDRHVLGWDLPGHGGTPHDTLRVGFSMADLATAVLNGIDSVVGPQRFTYAGDSVGGAVGLQLALDHPERVQHLTMLCSAARFGTTQAWLQRTELVRGAGMAPMVESAPARWFGTAIQESPNERIPALLDDLAAVSPEGYARVCEALASFDVRDRLASLAVPLLAVAGEQDVATPPSLMAALVDAVPSGRLEVLEAVGHLAPYEAPQATSVLLSPH